MSRWRQFWNDEYGVVLSAEMVLIGTLTILGATAGLSTVATALNEELAEVGMALRSLDQSYSAPGFSNARAFTAGSHFEQQDIGVSLEKLSLDAAKKERQLRRQLRRMRERQTRLDENRQGPAERQSTETEAAHGRQPPEA